MSQDINPNKIEGVVNQEAEKKMQEMSQELASKLHEQWKNTYKKQNPEATTRIKINVNGKWKNYPQDLNSMSEAEKAEAEQIVKDNPDHSTTGICEDLLNTPFANLSDKWKQENIGAAAFILDLLMKEELSRTYPGIVPGTLEQGYAPKVHKNWSKNNPWSDLSKVAYHDLPEDEKQKDRDQVLLAAAQLGVKYDTMGKEGEVLQKEFDLLNMQMKAISTPQASDERYIVRDQLGLGHTPEDN